MQVQTYSEYNPIGRYGCYFCSLGKIAEDVTGGTLKDAQVLNVYQEAVNCNAMSNTCFMKHPETVLNLFIYELTGDAVRSKYIGWWNEDMPNGPEMFGEWKEEDATHEVIRIKSKYGHHFGLHNWNPDPRLSGPLTGRRMFYIVLPEEDITA